MKLQQGIRVLCSTGSLADRDKILVSHGTELSSLESVIYLPYTEGALIPREPWRPLSHEEEGIICCSHSDYAVGDVWTQKVPQGIMEAFASAGTQDLKLQSEVGRVMLGLPYQRAVELTMDWLHEKMPVELCTCSRALGIAVKPQGMSTVTVNTTTGCRIGLHLDFWDKQAIMDSYESRVRCNINLGLEDRYFLFVNIPSPIIFQQIIAEGDLRGSSIGRKFLSDNPDYPVIRLKVRPGEAYFAQTDLLIHDATTKARKLPDICFSFLGHFRPGELS